MVNECSCQGYNNMTLQKKLISVGSYKFTGKKLGKGNFARVEEAIHTLLNVKVAVKIMDVTQIKEDYIIRNLHREARIMSQLHHPCIAALFQTMQNGSMYYLVTELIGGGDLCTFIKSQKYGKLEERCTRVYARQLISALAHMHNLGIVHRDLKMENIIMNSMQTQIKIVDFGLSNAYDPSSPLRTHCGSPEYAAPELFIPSKSYGPEVDLWSLGVILFGMIAGQLPFVTSHEENMSSQERRKRLLVQINKGYSSNQRKILTLASADFKSMIARMLVTEAPKRITTSELLYHTWVTDKGRKHIVTNPLRKLGEEWQISIMKQAGSLLNLDWTTVKYARSTEPHGDVAGIYNILAHRLQAEQLEGDGVTKSVQPQYIVTPEEKKENVLNLVSKVPIRKRTEKIKSPFIPKIQKVSIDATPMTAPVKATVEKRHITTVSSVRTKKSKELSQNEAGPQQRTMSSIETRNRLQTAAEKHIKQQLHYLKEQLLSTKANGFSKTVSTCLPKPRKCSSSTLPHQAQQIIPKPKTQQPPTETKARTARMARSTTSKNEVQVVGSKGVAKVLLKKKSAVKASKSSPKSSGLNAETVILDRPPNNSEIMQGTKPLTPGRTNFSQQLSKNNRFMPVMVNPSNSKIPTPSSTIRPKTQSARIQKPKSSKEPLNVVERSPFAQGDVFRKKSSKSATQYASDQKIILNDPIARSIVGYLVKTLPNNIPEGYKLKKTRPKASSAV